MPPTLSQITANFFVNLINRLGVRPPPPDAFLLSNVVQPVSIVDADVSISAILTTIPIDGVFTAGELVAPAANTILADTTGLAAGTYNFLIWYGGSFDAAGWGSDIRIQRRDAANAVNVWSQIFSIFQTGTSGWQYAFTAKILVNERIRLITKNATTAGVSVQGSIFAQLVQ